MDTLVTVKSDCCITDEVKSLVNDYSDMFDNYSETSEISELNLNKRMICSDDLTDFFKAVENLNSEFGYKNDISSGNLTKLWNESLASEIVPDTGNIMEYIKPLGKKNIVINGNEVTLLNGTSADSGSVAKGFVLDRVYEFVSQENTDCTVVSTGSTTLLYSRDSDHTFRVAVKSDSDTIAGTAEVTSCFVSTSGDYERFTEINGVKYHHILDINTGYPADSGLSSVTVFCDSGIMSDFLSTLIFTEGKDNLGKYLDSDRFRIIAADKQGNIYRSDSLIFHEAN